MNVFLHQSVERLQDMKEYLFKTRNKNFIDFKLGQRNLKRDSVLKKDIAYTDVNVNIPYIYI